MKIKILILSLLLLCQNNRLAAQYTLWVGETYQCFMEDYANRYLTWLNIDWSVAYGLYTNYSGSYVKTVSFSEYKSGTFDVTVKWLETDMSDDYAPFYHKSHTWSFTCKDNPLVLSQSSMDLSVGDTKQLDCRFTYNNSYTKGITYSSNNTSVATVSYSGLVTAKAEGTATITAKSASSRDKVTCTITVAKIEKKVTSISLNKTSASLYTTAPDNTVQLTATVYPSDATDKTVTWSSSNNNVATVSNSGLVTAIAEGNATITCKANDGSGVSETCSITVEKEVCYYYIGSLNDWDTTNNSIAFNKLDDGKTWELSIETTQRDEFLIGTSESLELGWDGEILRAKMYNPDESQGEMTNSMEGRNFVIPSAGQYTVRIIPSTMRYEIITFSLAIDNTNFPDENFRNWILAQDYGKDGKLTESEIKDVKDIVVAWSNPKFKNLKGIQYFTALQKLDCRYNQISSLDVSKNTALITLYCHGNQLSSLDVSKNTALQDLDCSNNQLSSLDLSKNTELTVLWCEENRLHSIDVSKNTALTTLVCLSNGLSSLDVSKNTALRYLECASNQLTSLDVSKNTALTSLSCSSNQLTSLDVSKNTALTSLSCSSNQLTSLDVSKNTALKYLYCDSNQLTSLDVSKNTALTYLDCYRNQIKGASMDALIQSLPIGSTDTRFRIIDNSKGDEGNECTKSQVAAAKAKGWSPLYYNGSEWVEYEGSEDAMPVADIRFVSVTCDNTNTDALTKNDKLTFHATFTNYGDKDEIATAVMICDKEVSKIIARSDYKWMTIGTNENVTIDYEYALDTIPNGEYTATVMHYDWNRESWIYDRDYLTDITIVDAPSLFAQGDVNMDNAVNGTDLVALSNIVLGRKEKTESADVNGDGSVNGTDIVALSNIILGRGSHAPRRAGEAGTGLSIEPFDIKAGEEKEMLIDLTNPNDELTLVQFDLHLPEGLSIKKNGADLDFDMADRTSWRKHTLDASETDGGYRFLLYSSSNTVIEGTSGAVIKVKVIADASFKGGKIVIDNTLLVSPDEKETKPEAYEYTFPTADDGSAKLAIEPFDIKAGEEKEMLIDLSNPNDEVTLVQFDLQLPEGLTVKKSGADLVYDMADRTSWRKHTLDANETDGGYRFLLYSSSNTVIDGTESTIIKVTLTASQDMTGKTIALDNILLVSPDEKETKPARYEYVIGSDTGIRAITIDNDADAPIYNLRGQRLTAPQKGINIIGGKKVVVK